MKSKKVFHDDGRIAVHAYTAKVSGLPAWHRGINVLEVSDLHLREAMDKTPKKPVCKLDRKSGTFLIDLGKRFPDLKQEDIDRIDGMDGRKTLEVRLSKVHSLVLEADGNEVTAYKTYAPDRLDRLLGWRDSKGRNRLDRLLGREGKPELANTNHFDRLIKKQLERVISLLERLPEMLQRSGRRPDIVLMLGDYIARNIKDITPKAHAALSSLCYDAPVRTAVFGNSDYTREFGMIVWKMEKAGFVNLTNRYLEREIGGARVTVLGVDDYNKGKPQEPVFLDGPTLPIIAVHNLDALSPKCLERASAVFSGHAHGGEFRLLFGMLNGFFYMKRRNKYRNANEQTEEIKVFPTGKLCVSCMSWGIGRYLFWRTGVVKGHVNVFTLVPN
jgi:predicted MPP superfamily phosphohydrolase